MNRQIMNRQSGMSRQSSMNRRLSAQFSKLSEHGDKIMKPVKNFLYSLTLKVEFLKPP